MKEEKEQKRFQVVDKRYSANDPEDAEGEAGEPRSEKPSYVAGLENALAEKEEQLRQIAAEHKASLNDLDDARVRIRRELAKDAERARREMIAQLLDVLDNLERALDAHDSTHDSDAFVQGVAMVRDLFVDRLKGFEVAAMNAEGARFDPSLHEALSLVPVDDKNLDGQIISVIKDGYLIGDTVLRAASVAVGKYGDR